MSCGIFVFHFIYLVWLLWTVVGRVISTARSRQIVKVAFLLSPS
jgi:hypothetical protein